MTDNVEPAQYAPALGSATLALDVLLPTQHTLSWELKEFSIVTADSKMQNTWVSIDPDNVILMLRSRWMSIRHDVPNTQLHNATVSRLSTVYHGWLSDPSRVRISVDGSGGGKIVGHGARASAAWAAVIIFMDACDNECYGGFVAGPVVMAIDQI